MMHGLQFFEVSALTVTNLDKVLLSVYTGFTVILLCIALTVVAMYRNLGPSERPFFKGRKQPAPFLKMFGAVVTIGDSAVGKSSLQGKFQDFDVQLPQLQTDRPVYTRTNNLGATLAAGPRTINQGILLFNFSILFLYYFDKIGAVFVLSLLALQYIFSLLEEQTISSVNAKVTFCFCFLYSSAASSYRKILSIHVRNVAWPLDILSVAVDAHSLG